MSGHDSAFYWFPRITGAGIGNGILVPKTEIVTLVTGSAWAAVGDGGKEKEAALMESCRRVNEAAARIGFPVFIKTDLSSAKHRGVKEMKAEGPEDIARLVSSVLEDNLCKDLFPEGIMVREWLKVSSEFSAFSGLPIGREWRVFATKDEVLCQHPYWPKEAIRFHKMKIGNRIVDQTPNGWEEKLEEMQRCRLPESTLNTAMTAVESCPAAKAWSVDFALAASRGSSMRWYLIDMADARHSEHLRAWPECKVPSRFPDAFDDDRTGLNP